MRNARKNWWLLAVLLCLSMLFAVLAGCERTPADESSQTTPPASSSEEPEPGPSTDETAPVFVFEGYEGSEIELPAVAAGQPVVFPAVRVSDDGDGDSTSGIRLCAPTGAECV